MSADTMAALCVAHIDAESAFSGGEVQVFLLIEGLRARGHQNVLLCPPRSRCAVEAHAIGIPCREVGMRNDVDLAAVVSLFRTLRRLRPDIVHLHTGRATWLGGIASRLAGIPAVTTRRMDRPVRRGIQTRLVYRHLVQGVAAISDAVADRLISGGVPREKIQIIRSSIDPTRLAPARSRSELRALLGAGPREPVLLTLAVLARRKGIDVLLTSLAHLRARRFQPFLWVAGEGPERTALERQAEELGLTDRVRFLGHRPDKADLLAACDAVVLPSRLEGLGVAALEAMAAGRAVVASSVGGLREVVRHGETGFLVPPEDPKALAEALFRLFEDEELRTKMGEAGASRTAREFHARQMVTSYERLYRSVLAAPRGR